MCVRPILIAHALFALDMNVHVCVAVPALRLTCANVCARVLYIPWWWWWWWWWWWCSGPHYARQHKSKPAAGAKRAAREMLEDGGGAETERLQPIRLKITGLGPPPPSPPASTPPASTPPAAGAAGDEQPMRAKSSRARKKRGSR